MANDGLSEWDVIGDKPYTWEHSVARAMREAHGKHAHAVALERLVNSTSKTTVNWRVVLNLLDFFERKDDESI